ncbi:choice-of-anchor A family protein [Enterococcus sp. AZ109]|uniref:choice-of-anchor A family protein n=1 Tax=Enterococcus sp. AZ109 TaxID=2774634 RepID=UPI003F29DF4E
MKKKRTVFMTILIVIINLLSGTLALAEDSTAPSASASTASADVESSTSITTTGSTDSDDSVSTSDTSEEPTVATSEVIPSEENQRITSESAVSVFDPTTLYSYPLGVGTEFTAFAGGTITIGHQDTTGFMGADTINSMNTWPDLFSKNLPGGLAVSDTGGAGTGGKPNPEPEKNVTLVANTINQNLATVLSKSGMFANQKIIVSNGNIPAEKKSRHTANELTSFIENGIDSTQWQATTQANLTKISTQYQALTQKADVAVSDSAIQAFQETNFNGTSNKQVHQLSIDLSQYTSNVPPVVVFSLKKQDYTDAYELNFKKGSSGVLPYIIFNWQTDDSNSWDWGWNNSITISGDSSIAELGNRMIHSFPSAKQVTIQATKFYGSILAPQGNISVGEAGVDLIHSSYVAGGNIEMKSELTLSDATANQFDRGGWPGKQTPDSSSHNVIPTIALTRDGSVVPSQFQILQGEAVHLGIQTTNYQGDVVDEAIDNEAFMPVSIDRGIDLENLPVGKHTLTVQIPGNTDIKIQVTIIVSGYLTLDEIPNLQFGTKSLAQYVAEPTYQLVDGSITDGATSDGDDQLTVQITDNRYAEQQSPWSLSVQLSAFNNGKDDLNGSIDFSSEDTNGLLNGQVTSGQSLTFSKDSGTAVSGNVKEKLSTKTSLKLNDSVPEPGIYQGKLSWTLSNAPQ